MRDVKGFVKQKNWGIKQNDFFYLNFLQISLNTFVFIDFISLLQSMQQFLQLDI